MLLALTGESGEAEFTLFSFKISLVFSDLNISQSLSDDVICGGDRGILAIIREHSLA